MLLNIAPKILFASTIPTVVPIAHCGNKSADILNDTASPSLCCLAPGNKIRLLLQNILVLLLLGRFELVGMVTQDFSSKVANQVSQLGGCEQLSHILGCKKCHHAMQCFVARNAEGLFR